MIEYEICGVKIKSVQSVKDIGVAVSCKLKFPQQCNEAAKKANRRLCLINRNYSFKNKDIVLPLSNSFVWRALYEVCRAVLISSCEGHC